MTRTTTHKLLAVGGLAVLFTFVAITPIIHTLSPLGMAPLRAAPHPLQTITTTITTTRTPSTTPLPVMPPTHTATLSPTSSISPTTPPKLTPTNTLTVPTATDTPTPAATPTPSPSPSPTSSPTLIPTPSPTPTLTPTATLGTVISKTVSQYWPVALLICLVVPLLLLMAALLWRRGRERRKQGPERREGQPPPPPPSVPPPGAIATPYLESAAISGATQRFDLKPGGMTIGRAIENDLVITPDFPEWETVSKHHARIYQQGEMWIIEDLRSRNGVYVNGRRTGRNLLRDGWQLDIGGVQFTFRETPHSREA